MTDQERIDRETLLKRAAAVAGAVYLAPVLTSAAAAGSDGCLNFTCSNKKKKWKKKHRKKCQNSGAGCDCPAPGTLCQGHGDGEPCNRQNPNACSPLEVCGNFLMLKSFQTRRTNPEQSNPLDFESPPKR